jgi:CheY-like chemotaxis protein
MRILVLEDDPLAADGMARILEQGGHSVVGPAATVQAALALVRETLPDLALIDVDLGKGGSGIAAARGLARHFGVPSLFVTADLERAREASDAALGLVAKPVRRSALLDAVRMAEQLLAGERPPTPPGVERYDRDAVTPPRPVRSAPDAQA